jgi:hypothetical protein
MEEVMIRIVPIATLLSLLYPAPTVEADPTVALIAESWKARESRIPSAEIEFEAIRDERVFRVRDQELQAQHILLVGKNDQWFHSMMGDVLDFDRQSVVKYESRTVYRGDTIRDLSSSESHGLQGLIAERTTKIPDRLLTVELRPIVWFLRPQSEEVVENVVGGNIEHDFNASPETSESGQLVRLVSKQNGRVTFWVDPNRDYVIVRLVSEVAETNIEYEEDPTIGFVPSRWTCVQFGDRAHRTVKRSWKVEVKKFIVAVLSDQEFELPFPDGAKLVDLTE